MPMSAMSMSTMPMNWSKKNFGIKLSSNKILVLDVLTLSCFVGFGGC